MVCSLNTRRGSDHVQRCCLLSSFNPCRSGLGIDAQRAAVARFAETEDIAILHEFTEVETGKAPTLDRRPQLAAALAQARQAKCPVIVAKLDRLSRDVAFIAGLMVQRVPSWSPNSEPMPTLSCCILCGLGREGAASHLGAHQSRPRLSQDDRETRQSNQFRAGGRHGATDLGGGRRSFRETILPVIESIRRSGIAP
ncbi:recombinase family protein [Mesorhizobium huakuii]|uniref:recombinase family protein n=1 Tax=Mesorhizobium huakuii TaxID=28104 RepID=UPI0032B02483